MVAAASLSVGLIPRARAANFFWDTNGATAGLGGATGNWDTTTANWFNAGSATTAVGDQETAVAAFTANDVAYFAGTAGSVTLTAPITVGGLNFGVTGYTLTGSTLTLAAPTGSGSPVITVNNNGLGTNRAIISSTLAGTSGFTKTGNGTLVLTADNSAGLSGDIAIRGGALVITNANQLGAATGSAISVTGVAQTGNPGFSGGALILQGTTNGAGATTGAVNLSREVSLGGRGPGAANATGALVSIGYNTLSGGLTSASGASETRFWATHGSTAISGPVNIGTGGASLFYGNGNFFVSGVVNGAENSSDRLIKTGNLITSTLWLQNSANSYAGTVRVDNGTVRVQSGGALGINTGTNAVDFINGTLEVRTDAPGGFASRNVRPRNNATANIFVDRDLLGALGIGGSQQAQVVSFGTLSREAGASPANYVFTGRNGYGLSFSSSPAAADYRGMTLTNSTSGTVTINGNVWNANNATTSTFTVGGNAETVINGNVVSSTHANVFTKSGTGVLIYAGTAGTYAGATNVSAGTLSFSNVGAFNSSSAINIGNATTTAGTLTYTGAAATLSKTILLNTTTAPIYINASGSGALTISGTFSNSVTNTATLVLGGTNVADNTITSVIPNKGTSVLSLMKIGAGTWVLAGTASNTLTGGTTVAGGTLKLTDTTFDILPDAGAITFNVDSFTNAAGGSLIYTGGANSETVGALTATTGHGIVTAVSGTLTFASLGTRTAGASVNVSNTGTVNVTGTSGFISSGIYFNGADFAYSGTGTTLRAPVYGTDAGFVDAAGGTATLTAGSHNRVTGAITAQTTASINSLKIDGANNLTLAASQTLTIGTAAGTGILLTGGSSTISGGTSLIPSAAGNDFAIRVEGAGNTLTINTPLITSTAGLTKSGNGMLVLGAANTITNVGAVRINEGTLRLAGSGLLGATDIDLVVRQGATFDLNGVSVGTVASGTNAVDIFNGAGTVTNTGAAATLRVGNGNGAGYFTGNLTGANLHLVKSGTAALSLTSSASDFGTLTIIGGTVAFALPAGTTTMNAGAASPLGTGATAANLVFNAGTLQYTGSNATIFSETQSPSFSTDRQFTLAGNATIQSSGQYGNNVLAGGAQNNASVIFASTADLTFSGSGVRTLTLGGNSIGDNEFRLRLRNNPSAATDYLSLTKADAGLWILNPATSNTYGGTTTISAGALRVASSAEAVQGLSASSPLVINGGVLETTGTFSRTLAAPVAGTGGTVQIPGGNSGFAASTPDRLVVTLGGGGLTWGSTNFAPAQLVLGSSTALGETEITNNIALGTSARTITVNNNANTGTMITAGILSGVISGSAGGTLTKAGGGVLILGDANTYVADTIITNGNLIVTSLGNASGTAASSLGASGGRVVYSVDADLNGIFYVGPGETSTRPFLLGNALGSTTARTYRIDASGSGPLVLNGSFSNTKASTGALTFELRGANTDGNQMNMVLANSATATLNVGKADGGTWILNPASANQFTGAITVSGGNLGLTAFGIGSA
ncbi:MAG: beta strand repeat-containing protein, partial [Arenimonas sp.]|uniref:beta strand repeat-containing protein n=1 Tax=Arenimonas sp. TaxID=1872635 RepID=UPI003C10789A